MFGRRKRHAIDDPATEAAQLIGSLSMYHLMAAAGDYDPLVASELDDGAERLRALAAAVASGPSGPARLDDLVEEGLTRASIGLQGLFSKKDIRRIYGRGADWRTALDHYGPWVEGIVHSSQPVRS